MRFFDWMGLIVSVVIAVLGLATIYAMLYGEDAKRLLKYMGIREHAARMGASFTGVITDDRACKRFAVHQTATREDLTAIWAIDCAAYGAMNVDFDILNNWWSAYPQGHYVIKKAGQVIGGFGIWPVKAKNFAAVRSGTITEDELPVNAQERNIKNRYWYLSGIVVDAPYRRSRAVWCLVRQAVAHWFATQAVGGPADGHIFIGSIPISKEGLDLLTRFGFAMKTTAEDRKNHHPFYERIVDEASIAVFLEEFTRHV